MTSVARVILAMATIQVDQGHEEPPTQQRISHQQHTALQDNTSHQHGEPSPPRAHVPADGDLLQDVVRAALLSGLVPAPAGEAVALLVQLVARAATARELVRVAAALGRGALLARYIRQRAAAGVPPHGVPLPVVLPVAAVCALLQFPGRAPRHVRRRRRCALSGAARVRGRDGARRASRTAAPGDESLRADARGRAREDPPGRHGRRLVLLAN